MIYLVNLIIPNIPIMSIVIELGRVAIHLLGTNLFINLGAV